MSGYFEQFKRDAVALYENIEDLSVNAASAELGINRVSLHSWVKKYGTGKRARIKAVHEKAQTANDSERIRQLEKEVSKPREERDILRKAAKYFAEETHW
ncbi:transposase [Corynebacterium marquesiae]|uniref:transposase n=1 Tax=Corynebacterium marquesiae TaxID=2913503 RepID=UPI0038D09684